MTSNMGADEKHDLHGDLRIYDCFLYLYVLLLVNFALELKTAFSLTKLISTSAKFCSLQGPCFHPTWPRLMQSTMHVGGWAVSSQQIGSSSTQLGRVARQLGHGSHTRHENNGRGGWF